MRHRKIRAGASLAAVIVAASLAASPAVALTVAGAERLLPIPTPPRYDELVCYRVKDSQHLEGLARFLPRQSPPFPVPAGCKVRLTAREFCIPAAAKFGSVAPAGPRSGAEAIEAALAGNEIRDDYLCYAIRCPKSDRPGALGIEDRFGARKIGAFRPVRICVPARKLLTPRCCDPAGEPGTHGNATCVEGASCCADGTWQCNAGDGSSSCAVPGRVCESCCDPLEMPGRGGAPACIEGASCCADGTWRCNDAGGGSTCGAGGVVCKGGCCDSALEPGTHGLPACIEGATCCADGAWACNDGSGRPTCDAVGKRCPELCGGIAGLPCDAGEFCSLPVGSCCCDVQGVCRVPPEACPEIFDPVCGCDGQTYSNDCEAAAQGVSIEHRGAC